MDPGVLTQDIQALCVSLVSPVGLIDSRCERSPPRYQYDGEGVFRKVCAVRVGN